MRKWLLLLCVSILTFALAGCGDTEISDNGDTPPVEIMLPETTEDNEYLPAEELKIQIDVATSELLSTFSNLIHADVSTPGDGEGVTLVIWANQTLFDFSVTALASDLLEEKEEWGFMPTYGFGGVSVLLPGEAFVIENYMGAGSLPHRGISFTDADGVTTRVWFFQENHAYPEHGEQWIIQEIEADRLIWEFSYDVDLPYEVIINGVGFIDIAYGNADAVYFAAGQLPTHVTLSVLWELGVDMISAGSQIALQYNGGSIGVGLRVLNYLTFGADRVPVGIYDTFMADDGYFTTYIPITLLRALGFDVYFKGSRVHIDGQLNVAVNPHPLAITLQNFIDNAEGETKAFIPNVGGFQSILQSIVAIEFVDSFAEAALFVYNGSEVISKEIGSIEGFPFSIGVTTDGWGTLVKITGDGGNRSYTMFDVAINPITMANEIVYRFTIYAELSDDGSINYYQFDGGWLEGIEGGRLSITEEEFNMIYANWGDRIICWRDLWNETEHILAMITPNWWMPNW